MGCSSRRRAPSASCSVASRMLTTSLVAFVRDEPGALLALHRAHAGGDGHVAEHSRAASPVMCILARQARAQTRRST
eukprot:scaffold80596_cov82-Phaeocystis_antarctica.AAC.1